MATAGEDRPGTRYPESEDPATAHPVSVVVVSHNSGEFLARCLTAVGGGRPALIVVDNASPSSEGELIRRGFPEVRLIETDRNVGFGAAANLGAATAESRWILLLNPDAWPIGDALERLVDFADRDPRLGAVGPQLISPGGERRRSTLRAPLSPAALAVWAAFPGAVTRAYTIVRRAIGDRGTSEVRGSEFLQASALLVRRRAFEQIGGFDEGFFMFGEDADLCDRLRDAGWALSLCDTAQFAHVGSGSTRSEPDLMYRELLRSWLRLIARRQGSRRADRARRWLVGALRLRALRSRDSEPRVVADWLASTPLSDLLRTRV